MERSGSVVLLEFNELTPSLLSRFMAEGRLPSFARFCGESRVFTTDASEDASTDSGLLNPWVQWVSVHTGVTAAEHGIRRLGEGARLRHQGLTELLTAAGRRVLVFGSMNVRFDERVDGCVVPDPWTTGTEPHPRELAPYHRFVQKTVQDHTSAHDAPSRGEALAFLRFLAGHGLSASTLLAIARQLASEVTGKYRWRRAAILDRLQWDVFHHYYRRIRPHFSTFFLNSTAHLQHKFWRNMDPGPFKIKPSAAEQAELRDAVLFGYREMDRLLGRFMKLAGGDATLIFCTALSQQPCLTYEDSGGKTFYRAHAIDRLLAFAGVDERYAYFPVMSEQFHLRFDGGSQASRAMRQLASLTVGGQPALAVSQEGAGLFAGCRIFSQLGPDAVLESGATGSRTGFFDLFYQAGGIKSGMHHPDGMLWIRGPDRSHSVAAEKVPLRAIAPTILRLLGVAAPDAMTADPLIGPARPAAAAGTPMRRVS